MRSRANSLTACTARNRFTFFFRAILFRASWSYRIHVAIACLPQNCNNHV